MGMTITENNVKTAAQRMNILAKNKCTVADAGSILAFCSSITQSRATVPEQNYLEDFTSKFLNPASRE